MRASQHIGCRLPPAAAVASAAQQQRTVCCRDAETGSVCVAAAVGLSLLQEMLRRRHGYERLKPQGRPVRCTVEQRTDAASEGPLAAYCPVCWTVDVRQ